MYPHLRMFGPFSVSSFAHVRTLFPETVVTHSTRIIIPTVFPDGSVGDQEWVLTYYIAESTLYSNLRNGMPKTRYWGKPTASAEMRYWGNPTASAEGLIRRQRMRKHSLKLHPYCAL
jgi:hypothetical protein